MRIAHILGLEARGFLLLLAAMLAVKMLTRQINLGGLLAKDGESSGVSPERVQLLMTTIFLSAKYVSEVAHNTSGALPDVTPQWLAVFGGSGGVYASVKALRMWTGNQAGSR